MTIRLDHTVVPAKDKIASAKFFAEIFGLTVEPDQSLTFDFAVATAIVLIVVAEGIFAVVLDALWL